MRTLPLQFIYPIKSRVNPPPHPLFKFPVLRLGTRDFGSWFSLVTPCFFFDFLCLSVGLFSMYLNCPSLNTPLSDFWLCWVLGRCDHRAYPRFFPPPVCTAVYLLVRPFLNALIHHCPARGFSRSRPSFFYPVRSAKHFSLNLRRVCPSLPLIHTPGFGKPRDPCRFGLRSP